jgi:FkbM family methyltransferase
MQQKLLHSVLVPPLWAVFRRLPGGVALWKRCVATSRRFATRPGTNDAEVFESVVEQNEYRLPTGFRLDDIIVDIGAHIGSFCYAVIIRGARRVYAFEPDAGNSALATRNLKRFGARVRLQRCAVWRSDRQVLMLALARADDNLAGVSALWGDNASLAGWTTAPAIGLDELLNTVTENGQQRVRLLKIDCEAAEFPILLTSQRLGWIDEICGEYHEFSGTYSPIPIPESFQVAGVDRFTIAELTNALASAGFEVETTRHGQTNIGLFFARRKKANPQ